MTAMIRTGGLRGFRQLVLGLGGDPGPLLRRYRLGAAQFATEDALIPLQVMIDLLEFAASTLDCPDFGLRLGQAHDLSILGPLAVAIRNAPTVIEAAACASRYLFVQSDGMAFTVVPRSDDFPGYAELRYDIVSPDLAAARQATDMSLGFAHRMMHLLAQNQYRLLEVHLPHRALAPASVYRRVFGAPVQFCQPLARLVVSQDSLAAEMRRADPLLRAMAIHYITSRFPPAAASVSNRVASLLKHRLANGAAGKAEVASLLDMHPRTLQRRLAGEGTGFNTLSDQVRRESAARYLRDTDLPFTQIAGLVGLARQAALTRACRRWFGATPSEIRQGAAGKA